MRRTVAVQTICTHCAPATLAQVDAGHPLLVTIDPAAALIRTEGNLTVLEFTCPAGHYEVVPVMDHAHRAALLAAGVLEHCDVPRTGWQLAGNRLGRAVYGMFERLLPPQPARQRRT
jgi:hypothetical protein